MARRNTIQRTLVLEAVNKLRCHASADQVYDEIKKEHPTISRATVYRNLARFKQEGRILSVGFVNGQERFDGNTAFHPHFICSLPQMNIPSPAIARSRVLFVFWKFDIDISLSMEDTCTP